MHLQLINEKKEEKKQIQIRCNWHTEKSNNAKQNSAHCCDNGHVSRKVTTVVISFYDIE